VHSNVHLKLLEHFMCQAASSKYLSANIPRDLNVDKYCCENLTILNPLLQYITQICYLAEYSVTFYCWQNFEIKETSELLWHGKPTRQQNPKSPNL